MVATNTDEPGRTDPLGHPTRWQMFLSTSGVTAVAVAQPILDLLGKTPDFFIARAAPAGDVVILAVLLGILIPIAVAAVVLLTHIIHPTAGRALHLSILVVMGYLMAIGVIRLSSVSGWAWVLVAAVSLLFGSLLAWGYRRLDWVRSLLSFVGAAPIAITAAFLFLSPTGDVAWGMDQAIASPFARVRAPAPVVMIVLDEFPVASIVDSEGRIREDDFPAFAKVADDATWFRNAVSTHETTRDAIPTMLTGIAQVPGEKLPHFADHPSNIFTLVGGEYEVDAIETMTQLCPETVCSRGSRIVAGFEDRWASLRADLTIVSGHLFLPAELSDRLPPIDQNWEDFGAGTVERPEGWSMRDRMREQVQGGRRDELHRFLEGLKLPLRSNEFHFIHVPLPHRPWFFMADGRSYPQTGGIPGASGGRWSSNAFTVEQAYQRHLLQLQYADLVVGSAIGMLEESGSYDSSIVVVTSDHGISIRPDQRWRSVRSETVGDIAAVPLFIKAPHRERGVIDDYRAQISDIVPTVAGLIDAEIPWVVDGVDLFAPGRPERPESSMVGQNVSITFPGDTEEMLRVAAYHSRYFGDRGPFGLAPPGYEGLLGTSVDPQAATQADVTVTYDSPELQLDVDVEADHLPIVLSGRLEGQVAPGDVLVVTNDLRVVAVTESWGEVGKQRFQALVPPGEFVAGDNLFDLYTVQDAEEGFLFSMIGRT